MPGPSGANAFNIIETTRAYTIIEVFKLAYIKSIASNFLISKPADIKVSHKYPRKRMLEAKIF